MYLNEFGLDLGEILTNLRKREREDEVLEDGHFGFHQISKPKTTTRPAPLDF